MKAPIEIIMDRVKWTCCKCGKPAGTCDCWTQCSCGWTAEKGKPCNNPETTTCSTKLKFGKNLVILECPKCGKKRSVERDKSDPKGTKRIVYKCPDCEPAGVGFDDMQYFNARGKQIAP